MLIFINKSALQTDAGSVSTDRSTDRNFESKTTF